jgi:hypothetical protein
MTRRLCAGLLGLFCAAMAQSQTIPLYENWSHSHYRYDSKTNPPPQIDALAFANYSVFTITNVFNFTFNGGGEFLNGDGFASGITFTGGSIFAGNPTPFPYDMQSVLNFTNRGSMSALFGFQLDQATASGRGPMAHFYNARGASIRGTGSIFGEIAENSLVQASTSPLPPVPSYILVAATNLVNEGLLSVDSQSLLKLDGERIDLSNGALEVLPLSPAFDAFLNQFGILCFRGGTTVRGGPGFTPDVGINDNYWGLDTNVFAAPIVYNGAVALTPGHVVTNLAPPYLSTRIGLFLPSPLHYTFFQDVTPTNLLVQTVFIVNRDTNITSQVMFASSTQPTNRWKTPVIEFSMLETNVATGDFITNKIYFMDQLASENGYGLLTNLQSSANGVLNPTYMPTNYAVSRTAPCEFYGGLGPNIVADANLFFNSTYSNTIVTNIATAYSWRATNVSIQIPMVPGATLTNQPGRIEITADTLRMDRARIRGETTIQVQTKHLESTKGARIEVERLSFDIGHTNGNLLVQDLARESIQQFGGDVSAYSGWWTNYTGFTETNVAPDPADPMLMVTNIITNVVEIGFHVMWVENQLKSRVPAITHDLIVHSTNFTLSDHIRLLQSLSVDSRDMTVNGVFETLAPQPAWDAAAFPNLLNLTNNGTISLYNLGMFGADRATPYASIVNRSNISGVTLSFSADSFLNTGRLTAGRVNARGQRFDGPISIDAANARLEGGRIETQRDLYLRGKILKARSSTVDVEGGIYLAVTDSVSDAGIQDRNTWSCGDGVHLQIKPAAGDLFGTEIRSSAPKFRAVTHAWSAEDRGAAVAGFVDNAVIGRLGLVVDFAAQLVFTGTGAKNGLYVDFLDLDPSVRADLENALAIEPNLTLYFADANIPAEELDGKFDGRLKWVSSFAGPNSGVDVLRRSGVTERMNRGLRNSVTIDTDDDGVANRDDLYPLDADPLEVTVKSVQSTAPFAARLTVPLRSARAYQIEYTTDLGNPDWKVLSTHTTESAEGGVLQLLLEDAMSPGVTQRFYRVKYLR